MEIISITSFLKYFASIRRRTNRIISEIPADKIDWKPTEQSFSFADIIIHLANTEYELYIQNILKKNSIYCGHKISGIESKKDLISHLDMNHQKTIAELTILPDKYLNERCITPAGSSISVWKLLRVMIEHEIHHRGQIFSYLNMLNVKTTPIFGLTSEEIGPGSQGGD